MKTTFLARFRTTLISTLTLLCSLPAYSQCDWQRQILSAIKSRLLGEKACRILVSPPQQIFSELDAVEADLLNSKNQIGPYDSEYWRYQEWLSSYARRFSTFSGGFEQSEQKVAIVRDKAPNAFATGHYVVLTSGLVDWFTQPQLALQNLGLTPQQATDYLAQLEKSYPRSSPGPDGLIAITALESAHNLLGHADAFPLAQACDDYIREQRRQLYDYEKTVSLGKKPSWFSRIFSSGPSYTPLPADERQQLADADSLGNWLARNAQRGGPSLANSLRWLSLVPEQSSLPKVPRGEQQARIQYVSAMLCSDRSSLQSRSESISGFGRWGSSFDPPALSAAPPVDEAVARFQDFETWYPSHRSDIDRIARGELTDQEKSRMVNVELEAKPDKATLLVDGKELPARKLRTTLPVGPHVIASSYKGLTREQRIVIFEDGPTKFNVEAK
ncbi:MAG: hypothetical protein DMG67_15990 [Acidobacteria bacterium]|nr:MAG: hypothetical protein DMG67_15990 [Acidobacteriota bacterium]